MIETFAEQAQRDVHLTRISHQDFLLARLCLRQASLKGGGFV
jgi:hypothetical protein